MRIDPKKVVLVTLGLAVAGAAVGAVLGALVLSGMLVAMEGWGDFTSDPSVPLVGATFGGLFGAVLGPLAAWLLMRSVPLGKAIGGTALGTAVGAAAAIALGGAPLIPLSLAGFAVAAVYLRVRSGRTRRAIGEG